MALKPGGDPIVFEATAAGVPGADAATGGMHPVTAIAIAIAVTSGASNALVSVDAAPVL